MLSDWSSYGNAWNCQLLGEVMRAVWHVESTEAGKSGNCFESTFKPVSICLSVSSLALASCNLSVGEMGPSNS